MEIALILALSFKLFILMDPIGNVPFYISFLKKVPKERHRHIIIRELFIALFIMLLFNFIGRPLLTFLDISDNTVQIAGGIILFILSIQMIFPPEKSSITLSKDKEPFIVPLAIPLVAGPAVLAAIMIFIQQAQNIFLMTISIVIAWLVSLVILLLSPMIRDLLKEKGIVALERLMGLILTLIAVEMFMNGLPVNVQ